MRRTGAMGGSLAAFGGLQALGAQVAAGQAPGRTSGYGPLVPKAAQNDPANVLALPADFNFQVLSRQGVPMSDGNLTPGIFDGMGAFRGRGDRTILIRNHENRRSRGEIPVIVPADKRYDPDPTYIAGDTKLIVSRRRAGRNPDGTPRFVYTVERDFAILGGTDTNCAGGIVGDSWVTCEETVNRGASGLKHGFNFEVPAFADGPVKAVPIPQQGRFVHEAVAELDGILYETEDVRITPDPLTQKRLLGSSFYRFVPTDRDDDDDGDGDDDDDRGRRRGRLGNGRSLVDVRGKLQALKLRDEFHANMDVGRPVGVPFRVEWVDIDDPDHDDDTDNRRDRQGGFTPVRVQAQDKGAAFFDREEGIWTDERKGKVFFDCTEGGGGSGDRQGNGQVWEYDPRRRTITLIFQAANLGSGPDDGPAPTLDNPDNLVLVPQTGDIFLQEDSPGEQYVRGLTQRGELYDFAMTVTNDTEFCGGVFDPDGQTLYLNQQGDRLGENEDPQGSPEGRGVTYAIYGPFGRRGRRDDDRGRDDDDRGRGRGRGRGRDDDDRGNGRGRGRDDDDDRRNGRSRDDD